MDYNLQLDEFTEDSFKVIWNVSLQLLSISYLYRVIHEVRTIFQNMVTFIIIMKQVHKHTVCHILKIDWSFIILKFEH